MAGIEDVVTPVIILDDLTGKQEISGLDVAFGGANVVDGANLSLPDARRTPTTYSLNWQNAKSPQSIVAANQQLRLQCPDNFIAKLRHLFIQFTTPGAMPAAQSSCPGLIISASGGDDDDTVTEGWGFSGRSAALVASTNYAGFTGIGLMGFGGGTTTWAQMMANITDAVFTELPLPPLPDLTIFPGGWWQFGLSTGATTFTNYLVKAIIELTRL